MKLSEICEYTTKRIETESLGVDNYISTENMLQNKGGIVAAAKVPAEKAVAFYPGDVLISNIRPYFKKIWLADKYGGCSSDVLCLRALSGIDKTYLYYLLSQDSFFEYVMSGAKGSKMPRGDKAQIMNWDVEIPDISEQKSIGRFLKSIDDKILLNNRINHNLEEQARALYKSWFVDFEPFKEGKFVDSELGLIPEGWSVKSLGEVTKEVRDKVGIRKDVKVLSPVTSGQLVLSEEFFTKKVFSESIAKYLVVRPGDFAYNPARVNIGSLGLNEYSFDGCVSPVYVVFRCEKGYNHFFDLYRATAPFKDEVLSRSNGGVRQTLGYKDFALIKLVYPPQAIIELFNPLYESFLSIRKNQIEENELLRSQRDEFLPRLLSGELKLNC